MTFARITINQARQGGVPCIRELSMPVATVVDLVASGMTPYEIGLEYPELEEADVWEALRYAAATLKDVSLAHQGSLERP